MFIYNTSNHGSATDQILIVQLLEKKSLPCLVNKNSLPLPGEKNSLPLSGGEKFSPLREKP